MSDLYRINTAAADDAHQSHARVLIGLGVLVPVERCEHGRVESHYYSETNSPYLEDLLYCKGPGGETESRDG